MDDMQLTLVVENFGPSDPDSREADILEVTVGAAGLRGVFAVGKYDSGDDRYLEVTFPAFRGFRYLDEGDLLPYWRSGAFDTLNHLVFEIKAGGWMAQEERNGMLNVTAAVGGYREWFIASQAGCLNVISHLEPLIRLL